MKRIIYTLGIIAAAAFTFSSCQKEQAIDDERPSDKLVTVTFTAEKAGTKTAAVEGTEEVSFIWTDEDISHIKLFTVGAEDALTVVQNPIITKESDTRLTISANVAPGNYIFRAVLAGAWTNDGKKPRVPENQSPIATNFDPSADVLISEDEVVSLVDSGEETVNIGNRLMVFHRPVVVNKMTLKNLAEGEIISKVVISSSKNLAGYFDTKTRAASGDKTSLVLNYTNASVPGSGQYPVYFTTIPNTGHSLTVEVTTDQNIYTKSFAEGASVDFNLGQFTKFNLALPEGTPNGTLTLPFSDNFVWASTGATLPSDKYSASSTLYFDKGKLRLGTGSVTGFITTKQVDLSSPFYVKVNALAYNAANDKARIVVKVDDGNAQTAVNDNTDLTADAKDYYFNFPAATANSLVTITVAGTNPRFALNSLDIVSGAYVLPPVINVTSDNPMSVANTAGTATIEYEIANPTEATLTATLQDATVTWISNIDYSVNGKVTFDVAAQEDGASARSGEIILSYDGADSKIVTVNQAAGEGGVSAYDYIFTSTAWGATQNGVPANWINNKKGSQTGDSRGIAIQKAETGAGATSPVSFTGISNITITLSKSSNGVGSVDLYVGENKVATQSSFTTTATEYSFNVANIDGPVSFVVNCSTSTLYVKGISITATGVDEGSGGGTKSVTFTIGTDIIDIASLNSGVTKDGITLSATTSTWYSPLRFYANDQMTISGATITKVMFNFSRTGDTGKITQNSNSLTEEGTQAEYWSGSASSVTFVNTATQQARISSVVVEYSN